MLGPCALFVGLGCILLERSLLHPTSNRTNMGKTDQIDGLRNIKIDYVHPVVFATFFSVILLQLVALFLLDVVRITATTYFSAIECFLRPQRTVRGAKLALEEIRALGWQQVEVVKKLRRWVLLWRCNFRGIVRRTKSASSFLFQFIQIRKSGEATRADGYAFEVNDGILIGNKNGVLAENATTFTSEKWSQLPLSTGNISHDPQPIFPRTYWRHVRSTVPISSQNSHRWRYWLGLPTTIATTEFLLGYQPLATTRPHLTPSELIADDMEMANRNFLGEKNRLAGDRIKWGGAIQKNTSESGIHLLPCEMGSRLETQNSGENDSSNLETTLSDTPTLRSRFLVGSKLFRRGERAKPGHN